jgi:hypothetical protein
MVVWGMVIQISIISYLSFASNAGYGRAFDYRSDDERPKSSPVFVALTILLLAVALFFPTFVDQGLQEEGGQFDKTYGIFYKKYRYWNKLAGYYVFFFFVHRIGFVFVLNLQVPFSITYYGIIFLCMGWLIFLLASDPYLEPQESRKELVNSYVLLLFAYLVPAYTFMTPEASDRFFLGNFAIIIVGILILVNFIWTIVQLLQDRCKKKILQKVLDEKKKAFEKKRMETKYIMEQE